MTFIGNFFRAADERHMMQPAFSRRIMALKERLGVDLLDRGSKPPRLTETGLWFRQVAQDLLADVASVPGDCVSNIRRPCALPLRTPCRLLSFRTGCAGSRRKPMEARVLRYSG